MVAIHLLFQKVYCGHEYTINNIAFAERVEPDNKDIKDKILWTQVSFIL